MIRILKVIGWVLIAILTLIVLLATISIVLATTQDGVGKQITTKQLGKVMLTNVNVLDLGHSPGSGASQAGLNSSNAFFTADSIRTLADQAIYINDGVISGIVPDSLAEPQGYEVIDMGGLYAMPGLMDMHTHILDQADLTQYLSYGVTTVRNMMGFPMHLRFKEHLQQGKLLGSRMITASPTLNDGNNKGPFHKRVKNVDGINEMVGNYVAEGYDFIKVYNGLGKEQFQEIIKAADSLGVAVAGHPVNKVPRAEFLHSSVISFEHIEEVFNTYMERKIDDSLAVIIANEFKEAQMPVCITLSAYHQLQRAATEGEAFIDSIPERYISPMSRFIGKRQTSGYLGLEQKYVDGISRKDAYLSKLTKIFYDQGVVLLLGTDSGPNLTIAGATLHDEIALWKKAGLPNHAIIRAGTINAAEVLGMSNTIGRVKEGFHAEILFLESNPLEDIESLRNPKGMIFGNHIYSGDDMVSLRQSAENKSGWFITMGNFLHHLISK
ncbi:MAG: amidohydrolase family protein [Flagellimonas sp.]